MIARFAPALSAIALLAAGPASAGVSDFRLPPATPTPTPRPQGPVDPENPLARPVAAPTASPLPSPAPTASPLPSPVPTVTATPTPRLSLPAPTPSARATRTPRAQAPSPRASAPVAPPSAVPQAPPSEAPGPLPTNPPAVASTATPSSTAVAAAEDENELPWGWIAFGLLAAAAAGLGWKGRRKLLSRRGSVLMVPDIEKPRLPKASPPPVPDPMPVPEPASSPEPALPEEPTHPLLISITPVKLTQTFLNEALSYRLALTNVGEVPLGPLAIAADLVSAHASLPREQQIAGPETALPEHRTVAHVAPGETVEITGEIRTPLAELLVIRQGPAALLVPLARFRVEGDGMDTRHFTLAIGQQQPGASGLSPIRLDLGPRTTDGLAGRAF